MWKLSRPEGAKVYRLRVASFSFRPGTKLWVKHEDGSNVPLMTDGRSFTYVNRKHLVEVGPSLLRRLLAAASYVLSGLRDRYR